MEAFLGPDLRDALISVRSGARFGIDLRSWLIRAGRGMPGEDERIFPHVVVQLQMIAADVLARGAEIFDRFVDRVPNDRGLRTIYRPNRGRQIEDQTFRQIVCFAAVYQTRTTQAQTK